MRAILDANILLSALLSPLGPSAKILEAWERRLFTLVVCEELVTELRDVASRPFFHAKLRAGVAEVLATSIQDLSSFCEDLPLGPMAPDPKDSYLLALAEAGLADFLVTGDKAILALGSHKTTKIISARAFAAKFELASNS